MASLGPELPNLGDIIEQSTKIEDGTPTRYHLEPTTNSHNESEKLRKITFGERDKDKPHKTILMVGETGTGKTKLINTMINYMLGVQKKDKVWFEITDDQKKQSSVHSQTSIITVYGFYTQESPIHLTIIDTPGYGDTHAKNENEIAMTLLKLSESAETIHVIDAVCLVIKATQNRLSDRHIYIFDSVQSLFGRDIAENIVLLFTHSSGARPKNALKAVKEARINCAVNDENQPVFFLFDNCQGETFDEEFQMIHDHSWNLSFRAMEGFFRFLGNIKTKCLLFTQHVLQRRKQLEENIMKIKSIVNCMCHVVEKVDTDPSVAKEATCCTVCEENCHYPGCWWASNLKWCSVMRNNHCTVCKNKCHYSKHVKGAKIYVTKTKKELQQLEKDKIKTVMEAFSCVDVLELIALNTDSLLILQHINFLIEKLKEINEPEKAEKLENIKKRAGEEKHKGMKYMEIHK